MKFLYHITKEKFLSNILQQGLLVNSSNHSFVRRDYVKNYYKKYNLQPIFLTNDPNFIIETQITKKFFIDEKMCILKILVTNLNIEDELEYLKTKWNLYYKTYENMYKNCEKHFGKSFICKENINKNRIFPINKNTNIQ